MNLDNVRSLRRLALTYVAVRAGWGDYCFKKAREKPNEEVLWAVDEAWVEWVSGLTLADVSLRKEPGVDWLVGTQEGTFGLYLGARGIPSRRPTFNEVSHFICIGLGDCPTWVCRVFEPMALPVGKS